MTDYTITGRISPKIKGRVYQKGDIVNLDPKKADDRLIADQLTDAGTIVKTPTQTRKRTRQAPAKKVGLA